MASTSIPPVPYNTPLLDANGKLNTIWVGWFRQLFLAVGGNNSNLISNPMTSLGDMIAGTTNGIAARLVGDTSNTRKFLRTVSVGGVAAFPVWDGLQSSDIPLVGIGSGGTGQITAAAAFNALAPITAKGDLIVGTGVGTATNFRIGNSGYVLTVAGGTISWAAPATSGTVTSITAGTGLSGGTITSSGTIALSVPVTVGNGGTGSTSVVSSPTATSWAGWDANVNFSANAFIPGFTTTATGATTTTLTIAATQIQIWTGSTTQTVKLPTTGVAAGAQYFFVNNSTGIVTVQSSGGNTIKAMASSSFAIFTSLKAIPTAAADWNVSYSVNNAGAGTVTSVAMASANGLSFSGGPIIGSGTFTPTMTAPTIQKFTSSSGTYTTPSSPSPLYIEVEMVGGGGGGSGSSTFAANNGGAGSAGGNSTFGSSLLTANGGGGGGNGGNEGSAGGSYTISSPATGVGFQGGYAPTAFLNQTDYTVGPSGAPSPFGGAGQGGSPAQAGGAATANTGSGGGGAGTGTATRGGGGGAAGGYLKAFISSPSATYAYSVGSAGSGGTAGTSGAGGGNGAAGIIIVREYYQ